jgi:hypothetical protein
VIAITAGKWVRKCIWQSQLRFVIAKNFQFLYIACLTSICDFSFLNPILLRDLSLHSPGKLLDLFSFCRMCQRQVQLLFVLVLRKGISFLACSQTHLLSLTFELLLLCDAWHATFSEYEAKSPTHSL